MASSALEKSALDRFSKKIWLLEEVRHKYSSCCESAKDLIFMVSDSIPVSESFRWSTCRRIAAHVCPLGTTLEVVFG